MHTAELLLTKEAYTTEDWRLIASVMAGHAKGFKPFTLHVVFEENILRMFVSSSKDLSALSNGLDGVSFRPVTKKQGS